MDHNLDYAHNLSNNVFLMYRPNSQILPNFALLAKSERSERDTRTNGGRRRRTHTLFELEAHLHKNPLRANNLNDYLAFFGAKPGFFCRVFCIFRRRLPIFLKKTQFLFLARSADFLFCQNIKKHWSRHSLWSTLCFQELRPDVVIKYRYRY